MQIVDVYTDGACKGNPGPGGWAAILIYGNYQKILTGSEKDTTNNRMELLAVINALRALTRPCIVRVHSDSKYIVNSVQYGYLNTWEKLGWKTMTGAPLKNKFLWEEIQKLRCYHQTEFIWVKGHDGNEFNERCDQLAAEAANSVK